MQKLTAIHRYTRQARRNAHSASILCFQHVDAAATQGYSRSNREPPIFPLAACFQHVYARKHVNASFFAVATHIALALLTLTAELPQVALQQPAGGDVSYCSRCRQAARTSARTHDPLVAIKLP